MSPLKSNPTESISALINVIVNHEDEEYERVVPKSLDEDDDFGDPDDRCDHRQTRAEFEHDNGPR